MESVITLAMREINTFIIEVNKMSSWSRNPRHRRWIFNNYSSSPKGLWINSPWGRLSAQGTYRFYSVYRQAILLVKGEALGRKRVNNVKNYVSINPLTAEGAPRALIDFTLSNARRFYSSKGKPLDGKGLSLGSLNFIERNCFWSTWWINSSNQLVEIGEDGDHGSTSNVFVSDL